MVRLDAKAIDTATDHVALTVLLDAVERFALYVRARRDLLRSETFSLPTREFQQLARERRIDLRDVVNFGD